MTMAPALAAIGAKRLEMPPPAENSAMSHTLEAGFRQFPDRHVLAAEFLGLADRTGRGQQPQFRHRKIALLQAAGHLSPDGAGGADDGHDEGRRGLGGRRTCRFGLIGL